MLSKLFKLFWISSLNNARLFALPFAICCFAGAFIFAQVRCFQLYSYEKAEATVVKVVEEESEKGETFYYPELRFVTKKGEEVTHTSSMGYQPKPFEEGERVGVYYNPTAPDQVMINQVSNIWGFGIGACVFGLLLLTYHLILKKFYKPEDHVLSKEDLDKKELAKRK